MSKQNVNLISPQASEMLRERLSDFVSNEFATVMGNKQWGYFSTGFVSFGDQYRSLRNGLSKQEQRMWSSDLSGKSKTAKRFTESRLREITDKRDERLFWLGYLEVNFQAERVYRNHYRDRLTTLWDIIKAKEPWRSYKIQRDDRLVYDDAEVDVRYLADAHQLGRKVVPNQGEFAFYRGMENAQWNQLPAVLRSDRLYEVEQELLQDLRLYYPAEFPNNAATVDWLARAQHFGLPTRLLDVTANPLVALYFAARNGDDGEIGIVDRYVIPTDRMSYDLKYSDSDTVTILANLSLMERAFRDSPDPSDQAFLHRIQREKPMFRDAINPEDLTRPVIVRTQYNNERLKAQAGAFILFSAPQNAKNRQSMNNRWQIPDKWIPRHQGKRTVILVRPKHKQKVLDSLRSLHIAEPALFPEMEYTARNLASRALG